MSLKKLEFWFACFVLKISGERFSNWASKNKGNGFLVELAKIKCNGLFVESAKASGVNGFSPLGSEELVDWNF